MNSKALICCISIITLANLPAWAHKKEWLGAARAVFSASAARKQLPGKVITVKGKKYFYHPVYGYIPPRSTPRKNNVHDAVSRGMPFDGWDHYFQFSPLFEHQIPNLNGVYTTMVRNPNSAFEEGIYLDLQTTTQAFYLWRLAHPNQAPQRNPYLYERAKVFLEQAKQDNWDFINGWNVPTITFLERLLDPKKTPTSYQKLYELTGEYPKHVVLDKYGFPVKAPDADYARLLDNYLMLAEKSPFNNASDYFPFILTKEEQKAAANLKALRRKRDQLYRQEGQLSPIPPVRRVLEVAYNQLETHTVPYSQILGKEVVEYKAYPNYKNTRLYRTIKGMIKDQVPVVILDRSGFPTLENPDMTHLIVLNAVMGGVDFDNFKEIRQALNAFEQLCADVHPGDERAIAHLKILRENLRIVFEKLLAFNEQNLDWVIMSEHWQKAELASEAARVLDVDIYYLVGRHWQQQY